MSSIAIVYGAGLITLGIVGYAASSGASVTALIPAFIGLPALGLGLLARRPRFTRHAMHAVVVLAFLALFGSARGLSGAIAWIAGSQPERPMAVIAQAITALGSLAFLALAVRSFIVARRDTK